MKNKLLLSLGSSLLVFAPVMTVVACGDDKPATPANTDAADVTATASAIKAAIKTGWTTATSETVTSSKTNANMPASVATATALTSAILTTDMGLTLAGTYPTDVKGTTITYQFTKNAATVTTGNVMTIKVAKGSATAATFTLNIQDTDQKAAADSAETANTEFNAEHARLQALTGAQLELPNGTVLIDLQDATSASTGNALALFNVIATKLAFDQAKFTYELNLTASSKELSISVKSKALPSATAKNTTKTLTIAAATENVNTTITEVKTSLTTAYGIAGALTSTMTETEWTAVVAVSTAAAFNAGIMTALEVSGTFPADIKGTTLTYTLAKGTDSITLTVLINKASGTEQSIVWTIAKPAAAVVPADLLAAEGTRFEGVIGATFTEATIATVPAVATSTLASIVTPTFTVGANMAVVYEVTAVTTTTATFTATFSWTGTPTHAGTVVKTSVVTYTKAVEAADLIAAEGKATAIAAALTNNTLADDLDSATDKTTSGVTTALTTWLTSAHPTADGFTFAISDVVYEDAASTGTFKVSVTKGGQTAKTVEITFNIAA